MKSLIVEDDFTSRLLLQRYLAPFGESHVAVNGDEALQAWRLATRAGSPYDLICLDIVMPGIDGQQALKLIRAEEEAQGVLSTKGARIVMITGLTDLKQVTAAYRSLCDAYLTKPVERPKLLEILAQLDLIEQGHVSAQPAP